MEYENLVRFGLDDFYINEAKQYEGLFTARITGQHRSLYRAVSERGFLNASVSGRFIYNTQKAEDFPAVGDWVMTDRDNDEAGNAVISHILRRKSLFTRKAAGTSGTVQAVAANIDTVFICMSLNADFNLSRAERYLALAWESGAKPVIVLTKSDLCSDTEIKTALIESVSAGAETAVCSAAEPGGWLSLSEYIQEGKTIAFIGSSGAGKSTLINRLIGEEIIKTGEIRAKDEKGRHTTTSRELLLLPGGGAVIDTPGMRELQLDTADISAVFDDIDMLAAECRYSDCTHESEPGCMVRNAVEAGSLSERRLASFRKLQRETAYAEMNSRQTENEKIKMMFGSKNAYKKAMRNIKKKNK